MIYELEKQDILVNSSVLIDMPFFCVGLDAITPRPGLTFSGSDLQVSQDCGITENNFSGSVTELGDGNYLYHLGATEIDLGKGTISLRTNRDDLYPSVFVVSLSLGDIPDFSGVLARPQALGFAKMGWLGF